MSYETLERIKILFGRVTRGEEGVGGLPALFWKLENSALKFVIQNEIFKIFQAKGPEIFTLQNFFFLVL